MHPIHRETLPNGLRVVIAPLPHLHTATVAVLVKVGSRNERERDNGLSHFLEHMLFRGTERHPSAHDLNLAIEDVGGTLTAATHVDFTLYAVTLPPESLLAGLGVFSEIFRAPVFSNIETEKGILREEILEDLDEDGQDIDVDNLSRHLLFAPHPLGFKITGDADNVGRFGLEDLRAHMSRYYGARNMVLCAAGALEVDEVMARARQHFGGLPPGKEARVSPPDTSRTHARFAHVTSQGSQTELRLSFPCFGVHDPRMRAMRVLSRVLDDGMSARLHRRICDELGLAYDIFAGIDPYEDSGVIDLGAAVEHDKAPDTLRELLAVLEQLRHEPVSHSGSSGCGGATCGTSRRRSTTTRRSRRSTGRTPSSTSRRRSRARPRSSPPSMPTRCRTWPSPSSRRARPTSPASACSSPPSSASSATSSRRSPNHRATQRARTSAAWVPRPSPNERDPRGPPPSPCPRFRRDARPWSRPRGRRLATPRSRRPAPPHSRRRQW